MAAMLHPLYRSPELWSDTFLNTKQSEYVGLMFTEDDQLEIDKEFTNYMNGIGASFTRAVSLRKEVTKTPLTWWHSYGRVGLPSLSRIALRILSQVSNEHPAIHDSIVYSTFNFFIFILCFTLQSCLPLSTKQDCSAGACERNWSAYSLIHTKIRNRLSTTQLEKLVYCRANMRLVRSYHSLGQPKQVDATELKMVDDPRPEEVDRQIRDEQEQILRELHRELESVDRRVTRSRARALSLPLRTTPDPKVVSVRTYGFVRYRTVHPYGIRYSLEFGRYGSSLAVRDGRYIISKGTGGRSSVSGIIATVFGCTGFLGRYVVQQLAKMGSQVIVPFRGSEDSPRHLKLMGDLGQIVPMKFHPRDENSIKAAIAKSNVVINLIGREFETRNYTFDDVHIGITEALSRLSKQHGGIVRYIQASCLGASITSPAKYFQTKAIADEIALRHFPQATVLRAGPLVGTEDRLLNVWAQQAKNLPFVPMFGDGETSLTRVVLDRLQPAFVMDIAAAIVASVKDDGSSMGWSYDLGGPDTYKVADLIMMVFEIIREHPRVTKIPLIFPRMAAIPRDYLMKNLRLPTSSRSFLSRDFLDTVEIDQVNADGSLTFKDLGVIPRQLRGVTIEHLYAYRTGGPGVGTTVEEQEERAGEEITSYRF
ncbi:hypothetical protein L7F22_054671 [Adiantum nelumboides]|nr:hypothetical protein [Adiantum nelumboides]